MAAVHNRQKALQTQLSAAHGQLPRQFGGVLRGLPGSFAAWGTRGVITAHGTKSQEGLLLFVWLTLAVSGRAAVSAGARSAPVPCSAKRRREDQFLLHVLGPSCFDDGALHESEDNF